MGIPPPAQATCANDWVTAKPKPPPKEAAARWRSVNSSAAPPSEEQGAAHRDSHGNPEQSPAHFVAASFAVDTSSHSWAKAFPLQQPLTQLPVLERLSEQDASKLHNYVPSVKHTCCNSFVIVWLWCEKEIGFYYKIELY